MMAMALPSLTFRAPLFASLRSSLRLPPKRFRQSLTLCSPSMIVHSKWTPSWSHGAPAAATTTTRAKSTKTQLVESIERRIKFTGPLSVAAYMSEILTHPDSGYYEAGDVFGVAGDYITSPEISQMFGELVAVWFVNEWVNAGSPERVRLIELGPGRGTLLDDACRVFARFPDMTSNLELALIELSQTMRRMQMQQLDTGSHLVAENDDTIIKDGVPYSTRHGFPATWFDSIDNLPKSEAFSFVVAHEFFDALPIHKFEKIDDDQGWREIFIDVDESDDGPHHFRFVMNPDATPAAAIYVPMALCGDGDKRRHVEVSPASGIIAQGVARLVAAGGAALFIDYGHEATKTDTLRGFRGHQLWDVLREPGSADITADVDFSFLRRVISEVKGVHTYGPVTQRQFLKEMSIDYRLAMLLRNADEERQKELISGFKMMTDAEQMGERFKFFALRCPWAKGDPVGFLNMEVT